MTLSLRDILGLNNRFSVEVDGIDLGAWGACKGLAVTFDLGKPIQQGGIYDHETYLPGQVKYEKITLERAVNGRADDFAADVARRSRRFPGDPAAFAAATSAECGSDSRSRRGFAFAPRLPANLAQDRARRKPDRPCAASS